MFTVSVQKAQAVKVNWSFHFPAQFEKCSTHRNEKLIAPVRVWHRKSFLRETVPARRSVPSPESQHSRSRLPAQPCLGNPETRRPSSPGPPSLRPCPPCVLLCHSSTWYRSKRDRNPGGRGRSAIPTVLQETGDLGCPRVSTRTQTQPVL